MRFEWDPAKAARNLAKHGVSFEEAATAFRDKLSVTGADPDHSLDEDRLAEFLAVCREAGTTLLIVSHDEAVRAAGDQVVDITAINRPGYRQGP